MIQEACCIVVVNGESPRLLFMAVLSPLACCRGTNNNEWAKDKMKREKQS